MPEKTFFFIPQVGFKRVPRRKKETKTKFECPKIPAEKSVPLGFESADEFRSNYAGILYQQHYIEKTGIRKIIEESDYPETKQIGNFIQFYLFPH